jgi:lantibiotic modifying enzyme
MSSDAPFLEACATIARRIVADAVWANGRCSWVGAVTEPELPWRVEYHALGPSLYGGTAGVGLFLAHVAAATGDKSARQTAVGALLHAASCATTSPANRRDGFQAGVLGIAWAAAGAALVLEEEELHASAVALSGCPVGRSRPDRSADLIVGISGSTLGLLALASQLDDWRLAERASATGDILISRATVTSRGWSWASPGHRYPAHLCGISHGAAGIGWALLELFAATGDDRFRTAAIGAFTYERSWLDRRTGRWPDLRVGDRRCGSRSSIDSGIVGTWCHGEAGIAMTRLRAVAVLGTGPHSGDAEIALATTHRHLADALPYAIHDLSLCHGLAGSAHVLLEAAALDRRWQQAADLAAQLGHVMVERYAGSEQPWPCGTSGEITPSLYLGLSGIGWLLLRLHEPAIPSPLGPKVDVDTHVRST